MTDHTFYCLSYLSFCLALFVPFLWFFYKVSRNNKK